MYEKMPLSPEFELSSNDGVSGKEMSEIRLKLKVEDIHPEIPEKGGMNLVVQVNAPDYRGEQKPGAPEFGALTPEGAQAAKDQAKDFFNDVLGKLDEKERENVAIMVFSSGAPLVMPSANSPHMRAFETGEVVIEGAMESLTEHNLLKEQIVNVSDPVADGKPIIIDGLVDLKLWEHPDYVEYLKKAYPNKLDLWKAYEGYEEEQNRLEGNVEGPEDIAIRMREALTHIVHDKAREFLKQNPDKRLFVWVVGHYDNIAPWLKGYVYQADPGRLYVPTDKRAGVSVVIDKDFTKAETTIGNEKYSVASLLSKPE